RLIHNCWFTKQQLALGQYSIGRVGQYSVGANIQDAIHKAQLYRILS
ncbi:hypothetical protein AAKU67_000384, partial [Oxalobacteraceae bacterium GrIS 2.11]